MSKRKEMIRVLDSISDFNTYSRYNNLLSKIFKNNSLKDLVSSLKNPIHIDTNGIFKNDEKKEEIDKYKNEMNLVPIHNYKNSKNKKKELDLLNETEKDFEEEKRIREEKMKEKKKKKKKKSFSVVNINYLKEDDKYITNPFKYKPNYNSIYKNIHGFKMVSHKTIPLKLKKLQEMKINSLNLDLNSNLSIINKYSDEYKSYNSESTTISNEKGLKNWAYKTLPDIKSSTHNSKTKKIFNKFNFNNTRRFSKYISRKNNIYKVNNRLTYLEPHFYSSKKDNKSVDFKKMIKRNPKDLMNKQILLTPSFTYYNPKYELFEQKPARIFFNKNDFNQKNKKYMLKKIWSSYYVVKDYLLVDNDKLNKKTNIKIDV